MPTRKQTTETIARTYRTFAEMEARGRSPLYEAVALGVARDTPTLTFLADLPPSKRQPNLLLAAVKCLHGVVSGWDEFRDAVRDDGPAIASLMVTRRTQTNEPARCATLVPLLARLPQPVALIELGAAAGLCLLPDRYAYDYGAGRLVEPSNPGRVRSPLFACRPDAATPLPRENIRVSWRRGLDLNPLDVRDPAAIAWLEALVWPDEGRRLELLRAAIAIAREDPPIVYRGDAVADAADVLAAAPYDVSVVVFHSALLPYLSRVARVRFAGVARRNFVYWIANESPGLLPQAAARATSVGKADTFLLSLNEQPIAWTDPHGTWINWIGA